MSNIEYYLIIGYTLLLFLMAIFIIFNFVILTLIKQRQKDIEILLYNNLKKLLETINNLKSDIL